MGSVCPKLPRWITFVLFDGASRAQTAQRQFNTHSGRMNAIQQHVVLQQNSSYVVSRSPCVEQVLPKFGSFRQSPRTCSNMSPGDVLVKVNQTPVAVPTPTTNRCGNISVHLLSFSAKAHENTSRFFRHSEHRVEGQSITALFLEPPQLSRQ